MSLIERFYTRRNRRKGKLKVESLCVNRLDFKADFKKSVQDAKEKNICVFWPEIRLTDEHLDLIWMLISGDEKPGAGAEYYKKKIANRVIISSSDCRIQTEDLPDFQTIFEHGLGAFVLKQTLKNAFKAAEKDYDK